MSVKVLPPSAPEYSHTENLYPSLPSSPDAFRLQNISDVQKEFEREADHYRQVAKKYKKAFSIAHALAIGLGAWTAALISAGIATAVTGIGAFASVPFEGVAAITGISFTLLTGFSKKIQHKLTKHEKLYTLAITKKNTVSEFVLTALNDNKISDSEFNLVLRELEKFHKVKVMHNPTPPTPTTSTIKTQLWKEIKQELQKKMLSNLNAESSLNLKF